MRGYGLCAQDSTVFNTQEELQAHTDQFPYHFVSLGWSGDSAAPVNPSTTIVIPEVENIADGIDAGYDVFKAVSGKVGEPGLAMGSMGVTYSRNEISAMDFYIKLSNGDYRKVRSEYV